MGPSDLAQVLRYLPPENDPRVVLGVSAGDDAAVYRLTDDLALVETVDFITPVVNDPYAYGAIAAANALSDIYAMGARPVTALSILGFPARSLPISTLGEILRGCAEKAAEAGVGIVGGHTVDDNEPKCGLAVTGLAHPEKLVTLAGARPGDTLVLTKPIGTGIISAAIDQGVVREAVESSAVEIMAALNRAAAGAMLAIGVNACTDIGGFGLLGHLRAMARASKVGAEISLSAVPVLDGVWDLVQAGVVPEGTHNNHRFLREEVSWEGVSREAQLVLSDAQTSGGLLISVAPEHQDRLLLAIRETGAYAEVIGVVLEDAGLRVAH